MHGGTTLYAASLAAGPSRRRTRPLALRPRLTTGLPLTGAACAAPPGHIFGTVLPPLKHGGDTFRQAHERPVEYRRATRVRRGAHRGPSLPGRAAPQPAPGARDRRRPGGLRVPRLELAAEALQSAD